MRPLAPPAWRERAKAMSAAGLSTRQIGEQLGIGRTTIWRWLKSENGRPQRREREQVVFDRRVAVAKAEAKTYSPDILAAGRFLQPQFRRYGR